VRLSGYLKSRLSTSGHASCKRAIVFNVFRASGRSVTYCISKIFGRVHLKAQTVDNSVNRFRAIGIYSAKR
jgi:hypothetical protein